MRARVARGGGHPNDDALGNKVKPGGIGSSLPSLSNVPGLNLRGGNTDSSGANIPLSGGAAARGRESSLGHMQPGFRTLSALFKAAQGAGLCTNSRSNWQLKTITCENAA
jgi:hypothetical protein